MLPAKITVALCWIYNLPLVQNRIFESSVVTRCFEKLFFSKNSDGSKATVPVSTVLQKKRKHG